MTPNVYKTEKLAEPITRQNLHEVACVWAEEQFKNKGGLPNMMWLFAAGPFVCWLEIDWEDNRDGYLYAMGRLMQRAGAHAYATISEAWSANIDAKDEDLELFIKQHGVAALPPDMREDMLMIATYDDTDAHDFSRYLVTVRGPGRGLSFLGPRQDEDIGGDLVPVQDCFAGLLQVEKFGGHVSGGESGPVEGY